MTLLHGFLLLGAALQLDSAALRRELHKSASEYERALRRFAPFRPGSSGGYCDETVGRFCITYSVGRSAPLPPEPKEITRVRQRTIEVHRRAAARWPGDSAVVGSLIRYLIDDKLEDEAVSHARRLLEVRGGPWPHLLLGLALQSAGETGAAEGAFNAALLQLDSTRRARAIDVRKLLKPDEQDRYKRLQPAEQAAYRQRLWRLADALYLTSGNEARAEHLARYVWSRLLSRAPVVLGSYSWGDDLEELTRRYGVPRARTQDYRHGVSLEPSITEHWDPAQLPYVPPELLATGLVEAPPPPTSWPYDTVRSRTGFAPPTVRDMRPLEHQAARFPTEDSTALRVDTELILDSLVTYPARIEFGLFVIDSSFAILRQVRDTIEFAEGDRAIGRLSVALPRDAHGYSIEALDLGSRLAGRARHRLPPELTAGRPMVSDLILLTKGDPAPPRDRADPDFLPLPSLVITRGEPVSLYLEVTGLTQGPDDQSSYRVDLQVAEPPPGALTRALRRIGSAIGLDPSIAPRITWTEQAPAYRTVPVAISLGELKLDSGLRILRVSVTDLLSGAQNSAERVLRIEEGR